MPKYVQGHPGLLILGTNRKRECDFLLVRHSSLGPIACTVSEILQVFVLMILTLILGVFPLDQIAHVE